MASAPAVKWLARSNPDAINAFLSHMGVLGIECVDVFSFDEEMLTLLPSPPIALIVCYPENEKVETLKALEYEKLKAEGKGDVPPNVFFMRQHYRNACGTIALFHSLANNEKKVDLGSGSFSEWLTRAKAVAIEERSKLIEDAAARAVEIETEVNPTHKFITFIVIDDLLYELDSSAPFPHPLGPSSPATLVKEAGKHVLDMVAQLDGNISFSALALMRK